jgi:methionyl-tRNA formyltransferase
LKVVVFAPIRTSSFSKVVTQLCHREPGVEVAGVVVRRALDGSRIRSELRRDGVRLARKVFDKLVLGGELSAAAGEAGFEELALQHGAADRSLPAVCRDLGIPCLVAADHNDPAVVSMLAAVRPDVSTFTGGGILRPPVLEHSGAGVLNAHMGILPRYRGMDVVEWALLEGETERIGLGVTLHFMAAGIDTGPILARRHIAIEPGDNLARLRRRFEPVMVELLLEGVRGVRDGTLTPETQEPADGRQYFVMHPRLVEQAHLVLAELAEAKAEASDS